MAARMRIIDKSLEELRLDDPATAVTKSALRKWVKEKEIPSIKVGRKILLNYDALLDYLSLKDYTNKPENSAEQPSMPVPSNGIRRVDV